MKSRHCPPAKVLTVLGTRPEVIKLAPVIRRLRLYPERFHPVQVVTGQHADLLEPLLRFFDLPAEHRLAVLQPGQSLNSLCARILAGLDPVLEAERPDFLLVQGDTTTALAGALAGFQRRVPVGHVEAGLRSGDPLSPYPEEVNRRLITRLATVHFAATARNRANLLAEGVSPRAVHVTGNPVVDSLHDVVRRLEQSVREVPWPEEPALRRRLVLTTHRRENFGGALAGNLLALRRFVEGHADVGLYFPVHPNPAVRGPARELLGGHRRIHLLEPLDYPDFIRLLRDAWLIASDSGGVQEEATALGKPLLILRENTERPEAVEAGGARLVGNDPGRLTALLEAAYRDRARSPRRVVNPFGRGDAAPRIVRALARILGGPRPAPGRAAQRVQS